MKKFRAFADVTKTISTDQLRPVMNYAIVENGRLISTDSHVLSVIKLDQFISEPEQLQNIEGKVFDAALIKKLAAADHLTFLENEIIIKTKKDTARAYYSGLINEAGEMFKTDDTTGETEKACFGKYPNWRAVVPHYRNDRFDFSDLQPGPVSLNPAKIAAAATALNTEMLHFFIDAANRPALTFAAREIKENDKPVFKIDFESFVLIMPVIFADLENHYQRPAGPELIEAEKKRTERQRERADLAEAEAARLAEENENLKKSNAGIYKKARIVAGKQLDEQAQKIKDLQAEIDMLYKLSIPPGPIQAEPAAQIEAPAPEPAERKKAPKQPRERAEKIRAAAPVYVYNFVTN